MTTTWTRQQHAFTSRLHPQTFTQKFAGTRNCPTLPLHWIVVTSHLTPRQIKQKVMGIHLVELFFFLSTWSLYCEFPINFPSNEFSFIGELFFGLGQISAKLHMIQNTFHKNYRMIPSSPTPPGDLRSATLHCNRSLQSTVGYTYLNLNSKVDLHGYLGVKVLQWNKMKHAKQKNPSSRTMPLFFRIGSRKTRCWHVFACLSGVDFATRAGQSTSLTSVFLTWFHRLIKATACSSPNTFGIPIAEPIMALRTLHDSMGQGGNVFLFISHHLRNSIEQNRIDQSF